MPTTPEYALFTANSYATSDKVVSRDNVIKAPANWDTLKPEQMSDNTGVDHTTGFLARAYRKGDEIVISYGGTTPENELDWSNGNIPAALGTRLAPQVLNAAKFYLDVLKANPGVTTISFTGHSLGGGLASLMAVYFNKTAQTFDQAPFGKSAASASIYNTLKDELKTSYSLPDDFLSYDPSTDLDVRKSKVTETYLKGEALQILDSPAAMIALGLLGGPVGLFAGMAAQPYGIKGNGNGDPVDAGGAGVSPVKLHSMVLLAAALNSGKFQEAGRANPELLQQIFKSPLQIDQDDPDNRSLLNLLLQQQVNGNAALDALADDLGKFKGVLDPVASGLVGATGDLKNALYGLALELYYARSLEKVGQSNSPIENVFKSVTGGIQFEPGSTGQEKLKTVLTEIGGHLKRIDDYLNTNFDRYTIGTGGALTAAGDGDKKDLMLGEAQADTLTGNGGNDTLLGMDGDDILNGGDGEDILYGGAGNDTLTGGAGNDIYVINSDDGVDTIVDDGANRIIYNGKMFAGMFLKDETTGKYKFVTDDGKTLEFQSPGVLTLDATTQIIFQNQTSAEALDGSFGLRLHAESSTVAPFDRTILGDLAPIDFDPAAAGTQTRTDDLGNIIVNPEAPEAGRADILYDSFGKDLIQGLGGNDIIIAERGGADRIEGATGRDWLLGGAGDNMVLGGDDSDVVLGVGGADKLYATGEVTLEAALQNQNSSPSGLRGDFVDGGDGDDLLIGGTGNDALNGGQGKDIIVAGAGDDDIDGDLAVSSVSIDWSVTRTIIPSSGGGNTYHTTYNNVGFTRLDVGGDDVIYAGAGTDWVKAGYGDDYVDGGIGDDVLFGQAGADYIFGGTGDDILVGDDSTHPLATHGDDYLNGGDGNDQLFGSGGNDALFGGAGNDQMYSAQGNDYLAGEDGDDTLVGGEGADRLFGDAGNDFLQGDAGTGSGDGDDVLDGGAGDDILLGLGGNDAIYGGDGADQIAGDNGDGSDAGGNDSIYAGAGADTVDAGGGDDFVFAGDDNDLVDGGAGNDALYGGIGDDQLQGAGGDDTLGGNEGNDTLFGQDGRDTINGDDGNDYIIGGRGDDMLNGGLGDDIYVYYLGDGIDRIADAGGTDWLVLPEVWWQSLRLGTGSLKLTLPDGGEIHLDDFDPDNPYAAGGIEYFQFADGTVMSKTQLINALGITPTGTPEADVLSGTALAETILALAGDDVVSARAGNDSVDAGDGNDVVFGGDGNDTLHGGAGDDVLLGEGGNDTLLGEAGNDLLAGGAGSDGLQGGEGDDSYLFQLGDGLDTVTDTLGQNAVALGAGLTLDSIRLSREGNDLWISVKTTTDRLTVKDWFAADSHFAALTLGDGTVLDQAGVEAALPKNQAPTANPDAAVVAEDGTLASSGNTLANDSDPDGQALRVTNPGSYTGSYGSLTLQSDGAYTYSLANGSSAVQSLAAGQSATESFAYAITDDDPNAAASATSTIMVTVSGANDAPVTQTDYDWAYEDSYWVNTGNVLANASDIDAGAVLTLADPGTRVGTYGTLTLGANGDYSYELANDSIAVQSLREGQSVTESFDYLASDGMVQTVGSLTIETYGRNDAPILAAPLPDQTATIGASWNWQVPADSFADIDAGDTLSYSAMLADGSDLPAWLTFDPATRTFSGQVPADATGALDVQVTVMDDYGNSEVSSEASDVFTLTFAAGSGGNDGGGHHGCGHGNEGVGNGEDPPPPGHDYNWNDGPGTSPGHPGSQHGHDRDDRAHDDRHDDGGNDHGRDKGRNYLDPRVLAEYCDSDDRRHDGASRSSRDEAQTFARWLAAEQAVSRLASEANRGVACLDAARGADIGGLGQATGGLHGGKQSLGDDAISLLPGAGLKGFKGLQEGMRHLG